MPLKTICLIVNDNLYESKRYFAHLLAQGLQHKGIKTEIINFRGSVIDAETIGKIKIIKPDLTCSFNSLYRAAIEEFFWDVIGIPHLSIIIDPVIYSINLIHSPLSLVSCVERSDHEALKSLGFTKSFFLPHAAPSDVEESPESERPYDVVMIGSCYDYESMRSRWYEELTPAQSQAIDKAIEIFFAGTYTSLSDALSQACSSVGLQINSGADLMSMYLFFDNYIRGKDRVDLVRSIHDAPVHVFGEIFPDARASMLSWSTTCKVRRMSPCILLCLFKSR